MMEQINLCEKFQSRHSHTNSFHNRRSNIDKNLDLNKTKSKLISNNKSTINKSVNPDLKLEQEEIIIDNSQNNLGTIFESQPGISRVAEKSARLPTISQIKPATKHKNSNEIDPALLSNKNASKREDYLDDIYSFDSVSSKEAFKTDDNQRIRCMINYSKDTSRPPLFKDKMKIPEFYSPPVPQIKVRVMNFAPKSYGNEIRCKIMKRQQRKRPLSIFDKSNYCLEKLLNDEHIDL